MNAVTLPTQAPVNDGAMSTRRLLGAYLAEARNECLRYLRAPSFMLPIMLFPGCFYLLFGIGLNHGNVDAARYLLVSYGVFGVMSPGLFGFGVSLSLERDGGLLTYKRALPMPPGAYLLGKMLMAMFAALLVIVLLLTLASTLGHVPLTLGLCARMLVMGVLGVLPFCALGMLAGTFIKGQGGPGALNLIYLPMSFLSGLWVPLEQLPAALRQIAPVWPSYQLRELGMAAAHMPHSALGPHLLYLAVFTLVCLWIAARRLQRYG